MKIVAAHARPVRLRFARPVRTARGDFLERPSVLFELRDADGAVGYGEAAPWPGFGTETADEALATLREMASVLVGMDLGPEIGSFDCDERLRTAPAARAAVQGALWDLAARRVGQPLARHLAACVDGRCGEVLGRVPASALLLARTPDELRGEAARARAAGHRAAKLKLGDGPLTDDVARARAAREGLGPMVALRGDANGAWHVRQAFEALEALAEFRFDYVEQPLPAADVAGLAELRRRAPVRVAADESVATERGVLALLAADAVDVVVLKPATLGGPLRALAIAARARRAGVQVVFTHAFESAVGARHVLHCAAAWGDATAVHGLGTAGVFESDVAAPVDTPGGSAAISDAAGLGITP